MYARVAAFANPDLSRVDELVARVEERAGGEPELPGLRRFMMLLDREGGTSLGITFFDTAEAIREAEPVFDRMGDEIPEEERGRRTSVEVYEVLIDETRGSAASARVSTLEGPPEGIDEGIGFIREQIVPAAGEMPGWKGIIALADRSGGRTKTITFWDGAESLRASEERANELRKQAAQAMDETITGVDRYEVALDKALAATSAST
jgi:hypothetical protein